MEKPAFSRCGIVISLLMASVVFLPTSAFAVVENVSSFEWSMPDRLLVNTNIQNYDPADPIPQYDPNAQMLPPGGWTVDFNACGVSTSTITSYQWSVDGVVVATVTACEFSHQFPEESSYHIALTVTDNVGDTAVIEETITVQDWLIVAMGDSYGSGEGNPEIPVSAQAHVDFSVLYDLAANIRDDLDAALAQLPDLEDAQAAAQQFRDDARATRDQAAADLARVQQDLQDLLVIETNVENDPTVVTARLLVMERQQTLAQRQAEYNAALAAYNNCTGPIDCAADLAALGVAQTALTTAQTSLAAAEAALWTARTAAVVIYSAIATIRDFDGLTLAIDSAQLAVNLAQNTYNTAQNAYLNAQAALQQTIDAVASLQSIIEDFQNAWEQAKLNAQTQYLDHLPVWTSTAPSWGTPEPTYTEMILQGQIPGEALRCHRSMLSGQARAALALEQADPHTSVTFVHLSCSGATITTGLQGDYGGQDINSILDPVSSSAIDSSSRISNDRWCLTEEGENVPCEECRDSDGNVTPCKISAQLDAAVARIQGREVDAMVISIGGNDIKFSGIIEACIMGDPCHLDLPPATDFSSELVAAIEAACNPVTYFNQWSGLSFPSDWFPFSDKCLETYNLAETNISNGDGLHTFEDYMYGNGLTGNEKISSLAEKMQGLNTTIMEKFPTFDLQRVYITEYPDPTGDDSGVHCGWDPSQRPSGEGLKTLPGVTQPEAAWAQITVATALREETRTAAATHTWKFVTETGEGSDTIGTASRNHGYCADDHWTVRLQDSLITQQDILGTMHPNRESHGLYKKAIYSELVADLYPTGIDQPPRPPEEPPVSNTPSPTPGGGGGGGGSVSPLMLLLLYITALAMRIRRRRH